MYEDELDLQRSGSYLDSSIASAWSERSLDPGDIRVWAALWMLALGDWARSLLPCHLGCAPPQGPCTAPRFPSLHDLPPSLLRHCPKPRPLTLFR